MERVGKSRSRPGTIEKVEGSVYKGKSVKFRYLKPFFLFLRFTWGAFSVKKWISSILPGGPKRSKATLSTVQAKFTDFLDILDNNNRVLKIIGDMEEKAQGEYLFDINYIRASLAEIREGVRDIVEGMISLGGEPYEGLRERYEKIDVEIRRILPESRPVEKDAFTIPFGQVGCDRAWSVGSKSAQLGEIKSQLGLPTPDGFAISAWAYKHFLDANDLQTRISQCIDSVDFKRVDDLRGVSEEIRAMVSSSPVPDDLAADIRGRYTELREHDPSAGVALRSSAIGEDTLFSFAGQYESFLNVGPDDLIDRYRDVLASKFTSQAIYYYLSHALSEADLAMAVGCVTMVDATTSGVIYTRDPVRPEDDSLVIYSIFGLGKYLVDGTLMPDVFRVSREDLRVQETEIQRKPVKLVPCRERGTEEVPVPEAEQNSPSLTEDQVRQLAELALKVEEHYGGPHDIEWAIDPQGRPFLLQARPLRVIETRAEVDEPDMRWFKVLASGGTTVCPGAGTGPIFQVGSPEGLPEVPEGVVLVYSNPCPGLVTVMGKVRALVTEVGSTASHMATLAREYNVPTLVGLKEAGSLTPGEMATVDATGRVIYAGEAPELIKMRNTDVQILDDTGIYTLLERLLENIATLHLLNPDDPDFLPERCETFHDITRFVHQRAMEEMFSMGQNLEKKDRVALQLKTDIPLNVNIIYIDRDLATLKGKKWIQPDEIGSAPMEALWGGIRQEGWPSQGRPADLKGFVSVMSTSFATDTRGEFSENSFAVLGKEYMILSLRLGYHFTTVEAMCTDLPSNNYIRMQYKGGGASQSRRARRIALMAEILSRMGFKHSGRGDFMDAKIAYEDAQTTAEKLKLLGRLTMMTKQLDMALSNDAVSKWYTEDFLKQLGLEKKED
jgi:pyruvate,water dikinase